MENFEIYSVSANALDRRLKELLERQVILQQIVRDTSVELEKVNEEIMLTIKLYTKAK